LSNGFVDTGALAKHDKIFERTSALRNGGAFGAASPPKLPTNSESRSAASGGAAGEARTRVPTLHFTDFSVMNREEADRKVLQIGEMSVAEPTKAF
jgi:hypothetical protein